MTNTIIFGSVCSGIEAASVAWGPLGWKPAFFAEIDKAACALLAYRYPHVPNLGDFSKVNARTLGRIDVLCGGTPCQAFSVAGARRGLDDDRGNLSLEFVRLAHELADGNGLRNAVWENVPGVLTMSDNAFGCFLGGLVGADGPFIPVEPKPAVGKSTRWWRWAAKEKCHAVRWPSYGMVSGPTGRAAWAVKDAQYFGLAQRRERVLVVADFGIGADPAAVLFERVSVPWHPPARGEARKDVAGTVAESARGFSESGQGWWREELAGIRASHAGKPENVVAYSPEIARCDATREGSSQDYETTTMVAVCVAPTVRSGGNTTGGDRPYGMDVDTCDSLAIAYSIMPQNSGKGYKARVVDVAQPLMASGPVGGNQGGDFILEPVCVTGTVTHTLKAEGFDASEDGTGRGQPIVAFDPRATDVPVTGDITWCLDASYPGPAICFTAKDYGADAMHDLSPTLRAGGHKDSHQNGGVTPAVAFQSSQSGVRTGDVHATLDSNNGSRRHNGAVVGSAVRRLTPRECERLMGFPDDYTRIPVRTYATPQHTKNRPDDMWEFIDGQWWLMAADGPRYKQLGNSWAVPKFRWLGERIQRLMPAPAASNDNTPCEARHAA